MKKYKLLIVSLLLFSFGVNRVNANIICNDGTVSKSCSTCSKGCCSRHGGCSNDTTDYTPPSNSGNTNNNKIVENKKEEVKEEPKVEEKIEEVETNNEVQEEEKILEETEPEIKEEIVDEAIEEEIQEEKEDTKEDLYYESKSEERTKKDESDFASSFLSIVAILGIGGLIYYKKNAKKEESKNIIDKIFKRKKKSRLDKIKDLFK